MSPEREQFRVRSLQSKRHINHPSGLWGHPHSHRHFSSDAHCSLRLIYVFIYHVCLHSHCSTCMEVREKSPTVQTWWSTSRHQAWARAPLPASPSQPKALSPTKYEHTLQQEISHTSVSQHYRWRGHSGITFSMHFSYMNEPSAVLLWNFMN